MTPTQAAHDRDARGLCIICEKAVKSRRRGLCTKHYEQYRRKRDSLSDADAKLWEEVAIDAGKLLPTKQGARTDRPDDAFSDLFAKFQHLAEMQSAVDEADLIEPNPTDVGRKKAAKKKAQRDTEQTETTKKSYRRKKSG